MRRSLTATLIVLVTGCAPGTAAQPVPEDATCYTVRGRTWPLGDTSAVDAGGRTTVVLERGLLDFHGLRGPAWAVDDVPTGSSGAWERLGADSVKIELANSFQRITLHLRSTEDRLSGTATGSTDEVAQTDDSVFRRSRYVWPVVLEHRTCPRRLRVPV